MDITWYGYSCFRITERGHTTVMTDPFQRKLDFAKKGPKAELVTVSHERAGLQSDDIGGDIYVITTPGEYEIGELFVTGVPLHVHSSDTEQVLRNIAYHFEYPNTLTFLHLGALHQMPEQSIIEQLGQVNVLLLPIGADLSSDELADLINMIEPGYVVPMHTADLDQEAYALALENFLRAMGVTEAESQVTLRVTAAGADEQTQVVCLLPAS